MSDWIDVASELELTPGQAKLIDMDDTMVGVFNIEGEYYALEDVCTHDGSPLLGCGLPTDSLIDADEIICPRHGARFSIKSGEALSAPAYEATTTFPTRVVDGVVQVRDDRWD